MGHSTLKLTVLGSGTSSGVPVVGCHCPVCKSTNPRNSRLRSSCLIETNGKAILIDTSPDLRQQALRYQVRRIDAVLFTHTHADHTHGIDELRMYNAWQKGSIPVYGSADTVSHLQKKFSYVFGLVPTAYLSLVPNLVAHAVEGVFDVMGVPVTMIPCQHGPQMTQNYRIGNCAWLTDTNGIPESSRQLLQNLDVLFIDGLRKESHPTHFCLDEVLAVAKDINAKQTYLIHLAHNYDHDVDNALLPEGISLAYDGLVVTMNS